MSFELILFDLDGTLVDSSPGIVNSFQYALQQFNLHATSERLISMIGPPVVEIFQTLYPEVFSNASHVKKALQYQRHYYSTQGVNESHLYPNLTELLFFLKNQNKILAVATSKPTVFAKKILQRLELTQYFDKIVGSTLNRKREKKSEIILEILKKYKTIKKDNIVMIGDRYHDIHAAKLHNIYSIGVTYGYGLKEEIVNAKPHYIVDRAVDLKNILWR